MTKIEQFYKRGNQWYWALERKLHIATLYVAPPLVVFGICLFFIQFDYIKNGNKRDMNALPLELKERLEILRKEELLLWQKIDSAESYLRIGAWEANRRISAEVKALNAEKYEVVKKINLIVEKAPYNAFSYKFYRFFNLVQKKD